MLVYALPGQTCVFMWLNLLICLRNCIRAFTVVLELGSDQPVNDTYSSPLLHQIQHSKGDGIPKEEWKVTDGSWKRPLLGPSKRKIADHGWMRYRMRVILKRRMRRWEGELQWPGGEALLQLRNPCLRGGSMRSFWPFIAWRELSQPCRSRWTSSIDKLEVEKSQRGTLAPLVLSRMKQKSYERMIEQIGRWVWGDIAVWEIESLPITDQWVV